MSSGPDELEHFLKGVLIPRALGKALQVCMDEDVSTVADLVGLRDLNQLNEIFTRGTALRIGNALSGHHARL